MLSVEIKLNETTLKKLVAVRQDSFKSHGAMHNYEITMVVEDYYGEICIQRDQYPVGKIKHRYCTGAVSLVEKMLKLARKKGMHK